MKDLFSEKEKYKQYKMSEEQVNSLKERMGEAKMDNKKEKKKGLGVKIAGAVLAAAVILLFVLPNASSTMAYAMQKIPVIGEFVSVITIKQYKYETDRNKADIDVAEITVDDKANTDETVKENLKKTTAEINAEIKAITDRIIEEFETDLDDKQGYKDVMVKSELISTTEDYFTVKLIHYQGAGSGYELNYFYTMDLNTGERLAMKDLFKENTDYITPISENIIAQMKEQMANDEMKMYWVDSEVPDWNFKAITDDTSFYVNANDNVVICFNEGDVAPMYMGTVEFEIPNEVIKDIRK